MRDHQRIPARSADILPQPGAFADTRPAADNPPVQFDRAMLEAENELLNAPRYQKERAFIIDCVRRLRAAQRPSDYFELQFDLLARFGAHQAIIDEDLKAVEHAAKTALRALVQETPKPVEQIREQQALLANAKLERRVSNAILHAFRVVGDGIAWRILGYDRASLTVLGEGVRVGRLAAHIGRDEELRELGRLWDEEGVFAIHNDITNCLLHGDLTAIRPGEGHVRVGLMEIKRGGRAVESAQLRRMDLAVELLNTGEHPTAADGEPLNIVRVPTPYRTFVTNLGDSIRTARRTGIAWTRPAPCLAVSTIDYAAATSLMPPERFVEIVNRGRERLGWFDGSQRVLIWSEGQKRMRDRRQSSSAVAPLSIFPLPVDDVADLILGFVDRVTYLNLDLLEGAFAIRGISAAAAVLPESANLFLEANRPGGRVVAPTSLREQMMFELMTPANAIAAVDHLLDLVAARTVPERKSLLVMQHERRVWDRGAST